MEKINHQLVLDKVNEVNVVLVFNAFPIALQLAATSLANFPSKDSIRTCNNMLFTI